MECTKCHIEVREPLELYNGEMACPKCRSNLSKYPTKFQATDPRARELFSLSELYYNYSLRFRKEMQLQYSCLHRCQDRSR